MEKKCLKCKENKDIKDFYKGSTYKGTQYYLSYCKKCSLLFNKKWRKDNPEKVKAARERWIKKNPDWRIQKRKKDIISKRKYRKDNPEMRYGKKNWTEEDHKKWLVNLRVFQALKSGKLKKEPCEVCGNEKVHAHHDDYFNPLIVKWLCPLHHKQLHIKVEG